jgi:hypothetical protein
MVLVKNNLADRHLVDTQSVKKTFWPINFQLYIGQMSARQMSILIIKAMLFEFMSLRQDQFGWQKFG